MLYLERCHPLKGVEYLEKAVAELNSNSVNPVNPVKKKTYTFYTLYTVK